MVCNEVRVWKRAKRRGTGICICHVSRLRGQRGTLGVSRTWAFEYPYNISFNAYLHYTRLQGGLASPIIQVGDDPVNVLSFRVTGEERHLRKYGRNHRRTLLGDPLLAWEQCRDLWSHRGLRLFRESWYGPLPKSTACISGVSTRPAHHRPSPNSPQTPRTLQPNNQNPNITSFQ